LKDDLHEGRSISIDALCGFRASPLLMVSTSKVELLPGRTVGLDGSNASGAELATLFRIVGMVFLMN
jgi:hypothetical protein